MVTHFDVLALGLLAAWGLVLLAFAVMWIRYQREQRS